MAQPPLSIHSRYNPEAEAERYAAALSLGENVKYLILIEPGLCYLVPPLCKRCPAAVILCVHAVPGWEVTDTAWEPGGESLRAFLERHIPDTTAENIRIVEWRPAMAACGEAYVRVMAEAAEFIRLADANARTTALFGPRWVRNFFKNIELARRLVFFRAVERPILVCAAGPSLEDDLPSIAERRGGLFVIAAASAATALYAAGVTPDLFLACDGGSWALLHLWEVLRPCNTNGNTPIAVAASLTAALPSQCAAAPLLPLDDGSLWQKAVLDGLGFPRASAPQRGTVAASALDLAFLLGGGKTVYVSGVDFKNRGLRTHARPYAFDRLLRDGANRFRPRYSQCFERERAARGGGSHDVYASWFARHSWPGEVKPFGAWHLSAPAALPEPEYAAPPADDLRARGLGILRSAIRGGNEGVRRELETLLGPAALEEAALEALVNG